MEIEVNKDYSIIYNPDFAYRMSVDKRIKEKDGYCDFAQEKCICKKFNEQKNSGFCDCKRYYKILKVKRVFLSGGTEEQKDELNKKLTLDGYIVDMPINFENISSEEKEKLEELERTKIAECDLFIVLNIDKNNQEAIDWAISIEKDIIYLNEEC